MQRLEWSNDLSIGIGFLDEQHIQIMELLNELIDAFNNGTTSGNPARMMAKLLQHTQEHFSYEESFMLHFGYPGYARHCVIHDEFMERAREFVEVLRVEDGPIPEWLLILVRSWFVDHVISEDMQYRAFLQEASAQGSLPDHAAQEAGTTPCA